MLSTSSQSISARRALLALGCSLGALAIACPAMAQAPETQDSTNPQPPQTVAAPEGQAAGPGNVANPGDAQEIIVTAQFRQQRLQDTPIAITAVNGAMLEARSQTNLTQVADQAPNVQIKPQGATFGPSISASIRGVGQGDFNPAYEPGVGIYIDDVYYPQLTGAVFDLLDLDRVEILRGPQGTLTGRNSIGGAIKMYSKKPTGDTGGYVEGTYGSRNRLGLRASADFKLTDQLFGRLSGVFKQQDGYIKRLDFGCVYPVGSPQNPAPGIARVRPEGNCAYDDKLGGIGYEAVRGILRWQPAPNIDINVIGDYTHDEHTQAGEVLLATGNGEVNFIDNPNTNPAPGIPLDPRFICGKFCNYSTFVNPAATFHGILTGPDGVPMLETRGSDKTKYDGWGVSGNIHVDITDNLSMDSITGYRSFNSTFTSDDDLTPAPINLGTNKLDHWSWSEELRLNGKVLDVVNFTLGGYYFKQRTGYFSYQDIRYIGIDFVGTPGSGHILPLFPLQFTQPDFTEADSKALFGHVSWEIVPNLNLSGGLRYTEEAKTYHYFRLNPDGSVNAFLDPVGAVYGSGYNGPDTLNLFGGGTVQALTGSTNHYSGDRVDWRASIDYRFSPSFLVYATASTGFKGGGTNPRPFNIRQVISFNPEVLTAYELGFKSDLFDRTLRLNVSAFYNEYKDIQLPVLACPDSPCAALLNAGDGEYKGAEAELFWRPIAGAQIDASLSYLDFKFTRINPLSRYPDNPAGSALDDPSGSPKWKASLGAQYSIQMGDLGSLTPRFDLAYQDKLYTGPLVVGTTRTRTFIPSYTTANARLTWANTDKDLEVSLEVTNLFDKYYFLNVLDFRGIGAGFNKGQPGRPREWAATVKKKF